MDYIQNTEFITEPMDFTSDSMNDESVPYSTPMKDYFRGKTVFLTGGTGFLGQLYVEKLLRSDVKVIYLLTRAKKGVAPVDRLQQIYSGTHFHKLKSHDPDYLQRIRIIEGDLSQLGLGISPLDLTDICENVELVLHAAADVLFDEKLLKLMLINLRGTRELLKICERIRKLEVVSYISTAYSNCYRFHCDEEFYEAPVDPDTMISLAEKISASGSAEELDILTERIIKPWPNTYTYSKSLSEELVRRFGKKMPICIIRPTIVVSTHEDPVPAWCNNIYGLNGVLVACGLGVLRLMPLETQVKGDIVCADFVSNSTLAAMWFMSNQNQNEILQPEIFHVNTTEDRPATWGQISYEMDHRMRECPSTKMVWVHCPNSTTSSFMWKYLTILYHVIPGMFFDFGLALRKKNRRLLPVYRKVHRFMEALKFFMQNEWRFTNTNMKRVWDAMSKDDREFYPSDVRRYDWKTFSYNYSHGLKMYLGLETMQEAGIAKKRYNKMLVLHSLVLVLYYGIHITVLILLVKYFDIYNKVQSSLTDTYDFLRDPK